MPENKENNIAGVSTDGAEKDKGQFDEREPLSQEVTRKKRWYRRWYSVVGMLAVAFVLLFVFVLPLGAKYYLTDWLLQNGASSAHIDKLGWNPFAGRLWLNGVDLKQGDKKLMSQADLDLKMSLTALFKKDISLTRATYTDLNLFVVEDPDGSVKIGTVDLPKNGESQPPPVTVKGPEGESSPWAFLASDVTLTNCRVHYISPLLDLDVQVDSLVLDNFSTREGAVPGTLKLRGSVNGKPVALDLSALRVMPALKVAGQVDVSAFDLDELDTILKDALPFFGGMASLAGMVDFTTKEGVIDVKYDGDINVEKADVGSESFRTSADNLNYHGKVAFSMPQKAPMLVQTDGVLTADGYALGVPGAELTTSEKLVKLDGATTVTIGDGVVVDYSGPLTITGIDFHMPVLQSTADEFVWKGKIGYDLAKHNLVSLDGELNLAALDSTMPESSMNVAEENFNWKGIISYQGQRDGEANVVDTTGVLTLKPLDFTFGKESEEIAVVLQGLGWDGTFSFAMPEGGSRLGLNGVLTGETIDVNLASAGMKISEKDLRVQSKTGLLLGEKMDIKSTSSIDAGGFALLMDGAKEPMVTLESLNLKDFEGLGGTKLKAAQLGAEGLVTTVEGDFPLQITVPSFGFNGFGTDDLENFSLEELAVNSPKIMAVNNNAELLNLRDITFSGLQAATDGTASVERLSFNKLVFLDAEKESDEKPGLSLGEARLTGIKWMGKGGFSGEKLDFRNLLTTIVRDKEGRINISERLAAMSAGGGEKAAPVKPVEKVAKEKKREKVEKGTPLDLPFPISLGEVLISGNSGVNFSDYTLPAIFKSDLSIKEFTIGELDSKKPEAKTPILFSGMLERRAPLSVKGSISPFLLDPAADLIFSLKNFPLQNVTAYTIQSVGTGLASGQLQVKTSVDLEENYLKMDNNVLLINLETKLISKELAAKLDNQLPIPLSMVLSVLKNKDGNIDLDIPLKGALDNLNIGLTDIVVTSLSKAVVPALSGYAIYALGPYGALAYAGMKLGEEMLKEGDTPVIFLKGAKNIVPEQMAELDKVGKKMQKGEGDWQLCPYVASWEYMSNVDIDAAPGETIPAPAGDVVRLDRLGQIRARNVQAYLSKKFAVAPDRLLLCTTTVKTEKKMLPLVIIQK
jgi:hypothetical protein